MRFTVSTKPLKNATNLGIIKSNISKLYYRSGLIQITATEDKLKMNIEATGIKTEMVLSGSGTISGEDDTTGIIVDCTIFKGLIDSIDADVITLDFNPGNITLTAGASKFAIPQVLDINEVQLEAPIAEYTAISEITINPEDWQFVDNHQTFALADQEKSNYPIYRNIWVSENHDVITGNYETSLFTHSTKGNFDGTCLLPLSLVNLFTSIPEGSKIIKVDKEYILSISTDSYNIVTEFTPKYEDDPAVGSYSSEIVFGMLEHGDVYLTTPVAPIVKFINQVSLLSQGAFDQIITFTLKDRVLTISNGANEYTTSVDCDDEYMINFNTNDIKPVLTNFDTENINIAKMVRDDTVIGCNIWSDNLTVLASSRD